MDHPEVAVAGTSSSEANSETGTDTITNQQDQAIEVTGEPPVKVRRVSGDDRGGETCPICLGSCSNSGDHRLVALKCGHLFGANCVEQWLGTGSDIDHVCPICKTTTTMQDVRQIYARRSVAAETSQIIMLQNQIETLQAEKNRAELDLQNSIIAQRACTQQLEVLTYERKKAQPPEEQIERQSWSFALEKNLEVNKYGGCRVLTHNRSTGELYVSQNAITHQSTPGYGIRKVSCVDCKLGEFVYLHREIIMDMTYSQAKEMLLSVGHSSFRITDVVGGSGPGGWIKTETPLWSCSWDYLKSNEFYVGGVGGVIKRYDVRHPSTCLEILNAPGDLSTVVSLCSTEYGLLSCQRNSCWLWVKNLSQWEPHSMPFMGPFMSLCYDYESNRGLVHCKPKSSGECSKIALFNLKYSAARVPRRNSIVDTSINILRDPEQTFDGSTQCTVMTRAAWVKAPGATWVAAHSESDSTLFLHGLDEAQTMSLPAAEPVLDVCSVQINGNTLLAALSDTRLTMYKAVSTYLGCLIS